MKEARAKKKPKNSLPLWCGGAAVVAAFLLSMPVWATDETDARATLAAFGFTPVGVGGFDAFGCGLDLYATRFTAHDAKGALVKGDVCRTPYVSGSHIELHHER